MESTTADYWAYVNVRSVIVGVLAFILVFRWLRRQKNLPPGPRGWPILGYLPQLALAAEVPHEVFSKLSKRYGDVISMNLAGNLVVILNGYNTIKEAFSLPQFSSRPRMYTSEKVRPGIGVIISSGELWVELRRFSLTVLRGLGVGKSRFEENIAIEAECLIGEWKRYEGAPFDPRHLITNAVSNVICSVVFGKRFQYDDPEFKRLLEVNDSITEQAGAGGSIELSSFIARLTFLPFVKKYVQLVQESYIHNRAMVDHHVREYDPENVRDFIDAFLKQQELAEKHGGTSRSPVFNFDNLTNIVGDLFFAGSETTSTTLRWVLLYMMVYPEIQQRVQRELDDVTNRNRFPRFSDKPDLPFTQAVICEIQRIATIAPLGVPHACSEDTHIAGYDVPKGTIVISNLWHSHFDPSLWEEPRKFQPERFLDSEGKLVTREELIPFGIGRRICLGEHLARMELFVFFAFLLYQFTFVKPPDDPPLSLEGVNSGTWAPRDFKVCAISRS